MPTERQTMMFSATWPKEVRRLASEYLTQPVHIQIGSYDQTANKDILQEVEICTGQRDKTEKLCQHIQRMGPQDRCIVFTNTKRMCEQIAHELRGQRVSCVTIHGDREQHERDAALNSFKSGRAWILVATDVAARGLDIKGVQWVINYDCADCIDDHVHRIGRTGRAGEKGTAISFIDSRESRQARDVMQTMEKVGQVISPELRALARQAMGASNHGRFGGKGKGKGRGGGKGGGKGYGGGGFGGGRSFGGDFGRPKW